MLPRTNYEMSEDDLRELLAACKPTPVMLVGGYDSPSPQENANRAWVRLGEKMGFDSTTVRPVDGKGTRFFTAVPLETDTAREERVAREKEDFRLSELDRIAREISNLQAEYAVLQSGGKAQAESEKSA